MLQSSCNTWTTFFRGGANELGGTTHRFTPSSPRSGRFSNTVERLQAVESDPCSRMPSCVMWSQEPITAEARITSPRWVTTPVICQPCFLGHEVRRPRAQSICSPMKCTHSGEALGNLRDAIHGIQQWHTGATAIHTEGRNEAAEPSKCFTARELGPWI